MRARLRRHVRTVRSPIEHRDRVAPQLPACSGVLKLIEEPGLLRRPKHRYRWRVGARIGKIGAAKGDRRRGMSAIVCAARIEHLDRVLRQKERESFDREWHHIWTVDKRLSAICPIVC